MEKQLIFLLIGTDNTLNSLVSGLLETNNHVKVINSEYIESTHDSGMTPYEELPVDSPARQTRLRNSIYRFLSTNEVEGNRYDIILDIDSINNDLVKHYAKTGKDTGHELISIQADILVNCDSKKYLLLVNSDIFEQFSEMLRRSTPNARIISHHDGNVRYVEFVAALHEKSTLIIVKDSILDSDQGDIFKTVSRAFGFGHIRIVTGNVDVTDPKLLINKRDFLAERKNLKSYPSSTLSSTTALPPKKRNISFKEFLGEVYRGFKALFSKEEKDSKKHDSDREKKLQKLRSITAELREQKNIPEEERTPPGSMDAID